MKKHLTLILAAAQILSIIGCAAKKVSETEYIPTKKIVEIKKDTPIYSTWDRWSERESTALILGKKQIIEGANLRIILADDPDPRVVEKLEKAQFWKRSGLIVGLIGAVAMLYGSSKKMPSPSGDYYGTDWGLVDSGVFMYTSGILVQHYTAGMYVREAQSIHNSRLNQGPGVSWNWSF
jgi:hypothetical protein